MIDPGANPKPTISMAPPALSNDFGRSVLRLSMREWIVVGLLTVAVLGWGPRLWPVQGEIGGPSTTLRMPFALSDDAWLYGKMVAKFAEDDRIPIIGDSVVWGEYVQASNTLSACLDSTTKSPRFANAGLNGAHPLALEGLVDSYAATVRNRPVILHCNLLWMSSLERDLQSTQDVAFNHPRLVPQFESIPAYRASFPQRVGYWLDRRVPWFSLVQHVRTAYFDGRDLQSWEIDHPYADPFKEIDAKRLTPMEAQRHPDLPWTRQGIQPQDMPWIDLKTSLQWRAWRRVAELLRSRGNRVFVIVGPFNEHLLTPPSRERYTALRKQVYDWLVAEHFDHITPSALPSDEYGDASHPLAVGYQSLARQLVADASFQKWLTGH